MYDWAGLPGANNTIRNRCALAASFADWLAENDLPHPDTAPLLRLRRSYPKTYGKVQDRYPARFLTHEEAFGALVGACAADESELGLRDEIILRLGLSGMRAAEITALRVGDLQLDGRPPAITWTGKGRKPRRITPSPNLVARLHRYLVAYRAATGDLAPDAPLLCRVRNGSRNRLDWGHRLSPGSNAVWFVVKRRAEQTPIGHIAPHDLRRTCASILHRSVTDDGAHYFDLLDVQKVLGHSDPATTQRSYLDPMDTGVLDRAAIVLD